MFLLKKVFQLRDKANPDAEKPFLEHLEDLRKTVTKVVVTLLITTLACFTFQDELMDILRKPISEVWQIHSTAKLPEKSILNADNWENAKSSAEALAVLPADLHQAYLTQLKPDEQRLAKLAYCYRAARTLATEKQVSFVQAIPSLNDEDKKLLEQMIVLKPDAMPGTRDHFKFMTTLTPSEAFMLSMKLAVFAGIVMAFPLLLLFTMQFILPGLHENEKKAIYPALAVGFILFLSGVLFSYLLVLPKVLEFFYSYGESMGISNEWRIGYYLSFATQFTLIFGLCFELPVVVWILVKIGLLNYEVMSRTRGYAIIAIVIIAAIITPTPDAFTLCLLAVPMIVLYELSIWLAWFDARKVKRAEEAEEKARLERLLKSPPVPKAEIALLEDTEEGEEMDRSDDADEDKKNE